MGVVSLEGRSETLLSRVKNIFTEKKSVHLGWRSSSEGKGVTAKPVSLSSSPRTHVVEGLQ